MAGATSFLDFPTHPLRHVVLVWLRALLRDAGDQQVVPLCDIVLSIEHLDELGHHFRNLRLFRVEDDDASMSSAAVWVRRVLLRVRMVGAY